MEPTYRKKTIQKSKPRKEGVEVLVSVGCSGLCSRMDLQSMLAEWGRTVKGMVKEIRMVSEHQLLRALISSMGTPEANDVKT